jgi:hypothetical protein
VKSRQLVCNESRVLELFKHFIPTSDDAARYMTVPQQDYFPNKQAAEYKLLRDALANGPAGTIGDGFRRAVQDENWGMQGMYVSTPSGKLLAGGNPVSNVVSTINMMRKGLDAYAKMPREERLLGRAPDPKKDRLFPDRERPKAPVGGVVLRVVGRGLEDNIDELCHLRPKFHTLDRVWLTRDEANTFLPKSLRVGETKEVDGAPLKGIACLYLIARGSNWHDLDVKELRLTSKVIDVKGSTVRLTLSGNAAFDASYKNNHNYRCDMLGHLTYDAERKVFTRFELMAYGMHSTGADEMKSGGPTHIPMGYLFTLNSSNVNDDHPPTKLDGYRFVNLKAGNTKGSPFR